MRQGRGKLKTLVMFQFTTFAKVRNKDEADGECWRSPLTTGSVTS